jgi:hypothetical protein
MEDIDILVGDDKIIEAIDLCISSKKFYLALLLANIHLFNHPHCDLNNTITLIKNNIIQDEKDDNDYIFDDSEIIPDDTPRIMETIDVLDKDSQEQSIKLFEKQQAIVEETENLRKTAELNTTTLIQKNHKIRVYMLCNWCSSQDLCNLWNKMSKGNYTWDNIQLVSSLPTDYYCVINKTDVDIIPEKTIYFRMEPNMEKNKHLWNDWASIDDLKNNFKFMYIGDHKTEYNNLEWHISKTYSQLTTEQIHKNESLSNIISTVLSDKYNDPGHIRRIDFAKFIEKKNEFQLDVFGGNKFLWKSYKGSLPYHEKDNALFPYKYTFNCENTFSMNYFTEKFIDAILSETLIFYSGCFNLKSIIDEKAFVYLELSNFENDYNIIKKAIQEDWWSQRIDIIRKEKHRILNDLQFFPRLQKIIDKNTQDIIEHY